MTKPGLLHILAASFSLATLAWGCATPARPTTDVWPPMSALPAAAPDNLATPPEDDTPQDGPRLRRGDDGFVYVTGLSREIAPGRAFFGHYGGEWPITEMTRPTLVAGRLVKRFENNIGLVHMTYQMPETTLDGLLVEWSAPSNPSAEADNRARKDRAPLGKALGFVDSVGAPDTRTVTLSLGQKDGVRDGDFYALLAQPGEDATANPASLQLSRRLRAVCMVAQTRDYTATCQMRPARRSLADTAAVEEGQRALFLEHTFGTPPREGLIQIAQVLGGQEALRTQLADAIGEFLAALTEPRVRVELVDPTLDATVTDFYRAVEAIPAVEQPQLVIGATVQQVAGVDHLFVNYGGVGPASGPGMVAAPPQGGVDLGPVDKLDSQRLQDFAATVWAGMLVYRGQTSEALLQLHQMLLDPAFSGPLRWHARDQYAMRWGSLNHYREALWLVLQDEAQGAAHHDSAHVLNAQGTRVRLYDFLDLPSPALQVAKAFLEAQAPQKPDVAWRSAMGMYAEMLMNAGKVDAALDAAAQLEAACPDGCKGDLASYVASLFWRAPADRAELRKQLLDRLIVLLDDEKPDQASALRLYQGLMAMRAEDYTQALIAFLEAGRLYHKVADLNGQARALYFAFMADLGRGEPQAAYERAIEAQKLYIKLNDFSNASDLFKQMSALYTNPDYLEKPGPFLGAARQVLSGAVEASLAMGNPSATGESLFSLGAFQLKIGLDSQAVDTMGQAAAFGVASAHFEIAALAHLYRAAIARQQGDEAAFRREISHAQVMAQLSKDQNVIDAVDNMLHPQQAPDIPTQLL